MSPASPDNDRPWLRPPVIVKVGGSLLDWPELSNRLQRYLATFPGANILLIPGGGPTADVIRQFDLCHCLGEEDSHWLALRSLALNARVLQRLLPGSQVVDGLNAARSCWRRGATPILDMYCFTRGDESRPDHLPHVWQVTSDSLAARVAIVAKATRLVLLKSKDPPGEDNWEDAAKAEYVDSWFTNTIESARFCVQPINLRTWT